MMKIVHGPARQMQAVFVLPVLYCLAIPLGAATRCVATNGNDSNAGTTVNGHCTDSSAWLHAPGMTGASGNASAFNPASGDKIIFRGGDTWTSGNFPMLIKTSGTGTASSGCASCVYYGVDQLWFSGGSWTRPKFDMQNTDVASGTGVIQSNGQSSIQIDNIEIANRNYNGLTNNHAMIAVGTGGAEDHWLITSPYLHGWHNTNAGATNDSPTNGGVNFNTSASDLIVSGVAGVSGLAGCVMDNSANPTGMGGGVEGAAEVRFCEIHDASWLVHGTKLIHDNYLHDGLNNANGQHPDMIVIQSGAMTIYNNLIRTAAVEEVFPCPGNTGIDNYFNNVIYLPGSNSPIEMDTNCAGVTTATVQIYNNTIVSPGISCTQTDLRSSSLGTADYKNNHCVSDVSTVAAQRLLCSGDWSANCDPVTNKIFTTNTTQASATATAQGYVAGNTYAPTSGGSTIAAGTNLTSSCTGVLVPLCSDTTLGNTRPSLARPASGAWDTGAYQFLSGAPAVGGTASGGFQLLNGARIQ